METTDLARQEQRLKDIRTAKHAAALLLRNPETKPKVSVQLRWRNDRGHEQRDVDLDNLLAVLVEAQLIALLQGAEEQLRKDEAKAATAMVLTAVAAAGRGW